MLRKGDVAPPIPSELIENFEKLQLEEERK